MSRVLLGSLVGCMLLPSVAVARPCSDKTKPKEQATTLAIVGDTPYGAAQLEEFPTLIAAINQDAEVTTVVHVGDIKNGSSACSTSYFQQIHTLFSEFEDALVYTPGDNEWTDCHRRAAGKFDPLERLETLRELFYATPGLSLGASPRVVATQADDAEHGEHVENQLWSESSVVFSTLHVVGSNNGLAPWFTDDATDALTDDPARREAEVADRLSAALAWLDRTFEEAKLTHARAVALFMQADLWDSAEPQAGFGPIVERIATLASQFKRPVLLVQGDSHRFLVDQPLREGDVRYGVETRAENLTRIVVEGETASEWLKLQVDPRSKEVFSWERVPLEP